MPDWLREETFQRIGAVSRRMRPDVYEFFGSGGRAFLGTRIEGDLEVTAYGWAYQYDLEALSAEMGRGKARTYLNVLMLRAVRAIAQHENASIRRGPFLAWKLDMELLNEGHAFTDGVVRGISGPRPRA